MGILIKNKIALSGNTEFTEIPFGQYSAPIQVKSGNIFANNFHYLEDGDGGFLTDKNLADLSTIANVDGVLSGVPANDGMWIDQADFQKSTWYNIEYYKVIFDLESLHNIDYAYVWIGDSTRGELLVWGSEDGVNKKLLYGPDDEIEREQWVRLDFTDNTAKGGNRFVMLGHESENANIKGFVIYGRPVGETINQGVKFKRKITTRPTEYFMGTNGFYQEHPELVAPVSGTQRFYVVPQWFLGDELVNAGAGKNLTPYDITYRWTTADEGNIDQLLQGYKNYGSKVMIDVNASPAFLRAVNTPNAQYSKAVDPGFSSLKLEDTTDPMKYTFIARISWVWAARYGANKNIDTSQIKLQGDQPMRVGLNLVEVLEMGNEFDRWWEGEQMYHNPQEMAAYMSAIYDGHKGAMGPGFGIKDADPSMKVSLISTASGDNDGYVNEIIWWCDKYRGKGDYPFDLINYHWYNSSEGSQDASINAFALQPELGSLVEANKRWVDFRDKYCPNVEVWLTEIGYDEHYGGVYSPAYATQFERSRYKAYWLTRMYMINHMTGVDVTNQYWFSNQGSERLEDSDQYEPHPDKFLTAGLTDGIQDANDWNRKPLMSYWYVANFKNALTGYRYSHVIMKNGLSQLDAGVTLIDSTQENIWAMAYKNYRTGENMIVAWLDSAEFKTLSVRIKVDEQSVECINIDNAEIRESTSGDISAVTSVGGYITLPISECPTFIKTQSLGIPLLEPIEDIQAQYIGGTYNLITWVDKNIGDNLVSILRSTVLGSGYQEIFHGIADESSYVDQTVVFGVSYYYLIEPTYGDVGG